MSNTIDLLGEDKNNLMQKLTDAANDIQYLRLKLKESRDSNDSLKIDNSL